MYISKLLKIISLYGVLDRGCPNHRSYRVIRKPSKMKLTGMACEKCTELWQVRQELNKLLKETGVQSND